MQGQVLPQLPQTKHGRVRTPYSVTGQATSHSVLAVARGLTSPSSPPPPRTHSLGLPGRCPTAEALTASEFKLRNARREGEGCVSQKPSPPARRAHATLGTSDQTSSALPSPSDGRALTQPSAASNTSADPNVSPKPETLLIAPPIAPFAGSRDRSQTRDRAYSNASPHNASPQSSTSAASQAWSKLGPEGEKRPAPYTHHRQTSIVHGVQHSRNTSLLSATSSTNASPLSPSKMGNGSMEMMTGSNSSLKKSPSMSAIHSNASNGAVLPTNRTVGNTAPPRRPERMHGGRFKRTHEHQRSQSRTKLELKTVGEYALHHLFTSFIAEADERIERCIPQPGIVEPRIDVVCGQGADPAFDQLISSLGHINRHKPNPLIDSVIHWRKKKADIANRLFAELQALRESAASSTQRHGQHVSGPAVTVAPQEILQKEQAVTVADRRSTISIYILCRMLVEIIGQTTLKALNGPNNCFDTAERLESVIYNQLQSADPDILATSPIIRANWVIRGQLLGVMSGIRFDEVAERFIRDLSAAQKTLSIKGVSDYRLATKTSLLVQSMRWIQFRTQPPQAWERSCDTLVTLAKFFAEVHGRTMKHAYAALFESLLLPIASTTTTEFSAPRWKEVISILQSKLTQMLSKADHWPHVFPLQAVVLCVSPSEQFATQWLPLIISFQPKSRDRVGRSYALKAICRLVWRYLYRSSESPNAVAKKLDEVTRFVFQNSKRFLLSTDPIIADPLIQLMRIIGYQHQDLCFRAIIFPMMNSDLFSGPERELKIENLDPEKTVIAIRAFLAILSDLETGQPPAFPTSFECDSLTESAARTSVLHRRTRSQGFVLSAGRTERLSRPVMASDLNDITREYYAKFCKILGQLTIICDNTFGGQAVLDEKFAMQTPKTPMAEAFTFTTRRDEFMHPTDLRQQYYDLLHVAVEALPRCLSPGLPINSLVNLLCTGTAHVQQHIAKSSAQSLKSIARQSHAREVTIGFARFIFNFDDRYATVSDGSLLGPGHIENTLELYVELLQLWIDDIERRTHKASQQPRDEDAVPGRSLPLDLSDVLAHVDEVESHGLFFLCSSSRAVRAIAVNVLRLVAKFDTALGKPSTRIISILEGSPSRVIDVNDERLSLAERSRLQKGLSKNTADSTLVELCSSDIAHDAKLWFKIFPNLVRLSSDICLHAVALTRELVCQRLSHSYQIIAALADGTFKQSGYSSVEQTLVNGRSGGRLNGTSPDIVIEQWKIHLIFACTTLTNVGGTTSSTVTAASNTTTPSIQPSQHARKSSKSSSAGQEKIASATELFSRVVPFLAVSNSSIRSAAVAGLGATNATLFEALLDCLQPYVSKCSSEAKERLTSHQRNLSSPRRSHRTDYLRTEITHLLSLTCHLLHDPTISSKEYVLTYMVDYTKHLRIFLSDAEIQGQLEFQKLRTHFSTLVETLYECIRKLKDSSRWSSFQSRQATFSLIENWCGFSPHESQLRRQEDHFRKSLFDHEHDVRNRGIINSAIEKERNELQFAALSSMATLCAGPLNFVADNRILMQFDVRRLFSWINAIFGAPSDRIHSIGRKALHNLIVHNTDQPYLMSQTMRMCYIAKMPKALTSYFEVVTKVLTEHTEVAVPFWKILCAALYTLGNEDSHIRTKSVRLLRTLEERLGKTSKLQDLDISVSDKTTAVYKLAQFEISRRLARQHPELAFHVFSEFSAYFNELEPDHQRNMVSAMLPWIQEIELKLEPSGGPTATSHMLLVNLFEITVKSSITLHNEIQALWQALATGASAGNVQFILDFIITVCLEKKEQNFVVYAKQIVVFLSKTPAGARVIDHLLLQINPKTMVAERRDVPQLPTDVTGLPYIADLTMVLPSGAKQNGLSLAQLSMILLVDLVVSPIKLPADKVPTLLQIILVQWDQYISIVQEQAKEMLVHLIHELVISKIEPGATDPDKNSIEEFIDSVRRHDPKITWSYADSEQPRGEDDTRAVPEPMAYVVDQVVRIFSIAYPGIHEEWGRITMNWATSCAVRHAACRSFQVFRCVSTTLDQQMLADMLARLSNTIADDENHDYLVFSLEILMTLRSIIDGLPPLDLFMYPQLFWTICACLDTIFEREFQEALSMLKLLLAKMDLSDPAVLKIIKESQPEKWEGGFDGVHNLVFKGVRSSKSMCRTLAVMETLIKLPSNEIVGSEERLLYTILANLPRYLHSFDEDATRDESSQACLESAQTFAMSAESQGYNALAAVLQDFSRGRFRVEQEFLLIVMGAIRTSFFPAWEFDSLVFLLGMVNNEIDWVKVKTMEILCVMIPEVDMRKPEIASQGPDLISPLLRLLQTPHWQQALAVLDNVIDMTGTPLDNKHLRMSMAGSHSSRATRKEYDSTKSLYGIPEESGWSVPMPAIHSAQTRHNLHAVFYTVAYAGLNGAQEEEGTPDIEFHQDDFAYESYFADRTGTMMSDDTRADGNMGELAMKLDSLDDFFDEKADAPSPIETDGLTNLYSTGLIEERENLYDQQALPILHQSLKRNASVTSFQTGFAERHYQSTLREPAMTPGAFAHTSTAAALAPPMTRPGLHGRSITTPLIAEAHVSNGRMHSETMSGDEAGDEPEPFSDDDLSIGRTYTTDDSLSTHNNPRPGGLRAGFRQGLRRLTSSGGSKEVRDAARAAAVAAATSSNRVPKVPAAWLVRDASSTES